MTRQFYSYSTGYVVLGAVAGVATPFSININNAYNFEVAYITGSVLQAGVLVVNWPGLVQINDSGAAHTWFDQVGGVPFMSVVGDGRQPYPLSYPRLLAGNSTQIVTFTQLAAVATSACLVLNGYLQIP